MPSPPRFVCLLASPRTGSSELCRLVAAAGGVNVKSELFHPNWAGALSGDDLWGLHGRSGGAAQGGAGLRSWRAAHPAATLESLFMTGGARPLLFKLFAGHLDWAVAARELLGRPDLACLILRRRPVESFISERKAILLGQYKRLDTTALRPVLEPKEFVGWARRLRDWRAWCDRSVVSLGRPVARLSYEADLRGRTAAEAQSRVLDALEALGLPRPPSGRVGSRKPQDDTRDFRDRAANWPEFEAALRAGGHGELLDWALA